MKLGQIIKNILQELSEKNWGPIKIYFDHIGIQITIDPCYIIAVENFFQIAINYLEQNNPFYKNIYAMVTDDIFFSILIDKEYYTHHSPLLKPILQEIETAMISCAHELSQSWVKSIIPINHFFYHEEMLKKYGNELIIYEQKFFFNLSPSFILRYLKNQHESELDIEASDMMWNSHKNDFHKNFLIGKEDAAAKFLKNIMTDLSPAYYVAQPKVKKTDEDTLKKRCVQSIARYSLFYPEDCSLEILSNTDYDLSQELLKEIEESPMEHVQDMDAMMKYKDKIIIFKTTSHYLNDKDGYLIYPGRKDLKVCFADLDEIQILIQKDKCPSTHRLSLSTLKYSNFKARLPIVSELDIIKQSIINKKAEFEYMGKKEMINKIDQQKLECESQMSLSVV
jgi:hypothetical protein